VPLHIPTAVEESLPKRRDRPIDHPVDGAAVARREDTQHAVGVASHGESGRASASAQIQSLPTAYVAAHVGKGLGEARDRLDCQVGVGRQPGRGQGVVEAATMSFARHMSLHRVLGDGDSCVDGDRGCLPHLRRQVVQVGQGAADLYHVGDFGEALRFQ